MNNTKKERDYLFDNYKVLLIFLVVVLYVVGRVSAVILNENAIAARRKSSKTTSKKGLRSASSKNATSSSTKLKSDLDKYYFYVDNGASYCPSGLNGIYATFSYDGDDEMIQEEFDNWYENNTKVKKDSDGDEIELDPASDFSYIKFTK